MTDNRPLREVLDDLIRVKRVELSEAVAARAALNGLPPSKTQPPAKHPAHPGKPAKERMVEWLKAHPGSSRAEIIAGTGLRAGTVGPYLGTKTLFVKRKDGWHAK